MSTSPFNAHSTGRSWVDRDQRRLVVVMILFRPTGLRELELVASLGWAAWPARLPDQPIFYPVLGLDYARRIAREWNANDQFSGFVGFVTTFELEDETSFWSRSLARGYRGSRYFSRAEPFTSATFYRECSAAGSDARSFGGLNPKRYLVGSHSLRSVVPAVLDDSMNGSDTRRTARRPRRTAFSNSTRM